MPLKKVLADFGKGVFSQSGGKKNSHKNAILYYQNTGQTTLPGHIYYEPPEDFEWNASSALLPPDPRVPAGEIIIHRHSNSPDQPDPLNHLVDQSDTTTSTTDNNTDRAYTSEEFTSAILARTADCGLKTPPAFSDPSEQPKDPAGYQAVILNGCPTSSDSAPKKAPAEEGSCGQQEDMVDSGVVVVGMDNGGEAVVVNNGLTVVDVGTCDCERRCSNPKHGADCCGVSPVLERRNKGVLGRLRNFASRTSYSTSEDGHSHSSDYEDPEEDKKPDVRFSRDSRERTSSSSWAGRVRDLHRDVKKKISRLRHSRGANPDDEMGESAEHPDAQIQQGSSVESIPSGSCSSLQPPTPTSSNRSSTSAGEDDHSTYVGTFLGKARALVDCTPSPYDRDGLAFKKGDIIDIIAKHKTGIWVGMAQGKVGHFKFINVEEIVEEIRPKHRRRKVHTDWIMPSKKPETFEELLQQLGLQEYMNVLVLNGYDELSTFKEIEKDDLDSLGIVNPDHGMKLLRAAEMLQGVDPDDLEENEDDDDLQIKQSPRDSGCYASHENLVQRDTSQRAISNGHFACDLEDQDTSHSESGIHSREGQDLTLAMNNLDLSAESSTKSTTMDDVTGVADVTNDGVDINDMTNFNIPPCPQELEVVMPEVVEVTSGVGQSNLTESSRNENEGVLSVQHLLAATGTKSSPGSPRKIRNKHHARHKSHSHRGREILFHDFPMDTSRAYSLTNGHHLDTYCDRGSYVYGWSSFLNTEKPSRSRRVHEYDDVVSDPANDPNESPGRHVFKRAKKRKGSLQTLIHESRSPSPTLLSKVNKKLVAEKIYLCDEPYTDKTGFCGIPPALVQRYAEELQHSIPDVADALDQMRITSLQQQARRGVPNDFLSDSCTVPVIEANYSCLTTWLTSLGLPMYEALFVSSGFTELYQVASLGGRDDLARLGIYDPYHQVYLESALDVLHSRCRRRLQTYPQT